ncbi:MAG: phosphoadenosine phosphosulfate reductase family protein [Lachnospiraceae bacterium]|nr:phosphoadenosine phosphosulfate reductase family protein [Lachnospiraceae bacterium]MCM1240478.1 phosphoadenosine phosphosulfate reductase family protein [Lachnospiraceae bacterium]
MDKEHMAIERIRAACEMSIVFYDRPLAVTISGGKDSDVLLELVRRSGVPFEAQHSHTTADAPQTVYHVREQFRELEGKGIHCILSMPKLTMWQLIPHKKIPPTRLIRYCCAYLKEGFGRERHVLTGVRWAESSRRKNSRGIYETIHRDKDKKIILNNDNDDRRRLMERCAVKARTITNPIVDWEDHDIWDFIESEHIDVNPLYGCGFDRVGCIGCPMAGKKRWHEFEVFPTYKRAYIKAFERMIEEREKAGLEVREGLSTPEKVFSRWMEEKEMDAQQISLQDIYGDEDW